MVVVLITERMESLESNLLLQSFSIDEESTNDKDNNNWKDAKLVEYLQNLKRGEYDKILKDPVIESIISSSLSNYLSEINNNSQSGENENRYYHLVAAVSCLSVFMQVNWTGPSLSPSLVEYSPKVTEQRIIPII